MAHRVGPFKPQEQHIEVAVGSDVQREQISRITDAISSEFLGKLVEPKAGEDRNSCDDGVRLGYGRG